MAILELCIEIVGADEKVDKVEASLLEKIRSGFEIPLEKYRDLCGRNLRSEVDADSAVLVSLLGIRKGMSQKEIRAILLEESRKWMDLQGSSNPEKREKAKRMLRQIAELKRKFSE